MAFVFSASGDGGGRAQRARRGAVPAPPAPQAAPACPEAMQPAEPPGASSAFVFSSSNGGQTAQRACRGARVAPRARPRARKAADRQQHKAQPAQAAQSAAHPPPLPPPLEGSEQEEDSALFSSPASSPAQSPMGRPPYCRRVLRVARPAVAAQFIPAALTDCLERLDSLPCHLRDRILATAVSWVLGKSWALTGCELGSGLVLRSCSCLTTRSSLLTLRQDALELLEPLAAEPLDVRHLVWRYAQACRRSRLHRSLARHMPFRAVLPAMELVGKPRKLRGCLAWLGGLQLESLDLICPPLGPAALAELAARMAELAPHHCAGITVLRVQAQGQAQGFESGGCWASRC